MIGGRQECAAADAPVTVVPPASVRTRRGVGAVLSDASVAPLTHHARATGPEPVPIAIRLGDADVRLDVP